MWCSRGCLGPHAISDACLWHVSIAGGARRRGCAAAGVPVFFSGLLAVATMGAMNLRRTLTPREYLYVAYAALAVCTLIVFTGAAVRLTGSGLGCPDWPRCDGSRLTPELHIHGVIE